MSKFLVAAFVVFLAGITASAAFAGAETVYPIHIQDIMSTVITALFTALLAVGGWLITSLLSTLKRKFNIDIDAQTRAYLNEALENGLMWAKEQALSEAKNIEDPVVKNEMLAGAVNYVFSRVPDAVDYFGLDVEDIAALLQARFEKAHAPVLTSIEESDS